MLPNMKYRRATDINKLNVDLYMYQYMKFGTEKWFLNVVSVLFN